MTALYRFYIYYTLPELPGQIFHRLNFATHESDAICKFYGCESVHKATITKVVQSARTA